MTEKKVWFITGACRGMGAHFAKAVLTAGHRLLATGGDPARVTEAFGPHSGHVIAISSSAGLGAGFELVTAYAASKFGLESFMESLRAEVAPS
jgi:NAD(P)-dependent dehydrogenase (short-subunit alcohol dehydrogenase family)